ncbi:MULTISPECIES: CDP-alcohol phosphatidyltransferase family protein [Hungatella]|uniref:CDP-alcohol phosphatidyltransferase family protein n=1 Tax=Hungatella TaxID=1649459 RepID=UPI002A82A30F|nr:CDP-alcohol phosphatidyltransferase family protein [Hungatella sp.]
MYQTIQKKERREKIKNLANIITFSRIIFALAILYIKPFSTAFWICYFLGGLSDLLDGLVARTLNQQSENGAKIDSIADTVFAASIFIIVLKNIFLPGRFWWFISLIFLIRIITYSVGFYKYRTFSSLHTYFNKASGLLIFMFPLLYVILKLDVAGGIVCFVSFAASVEELLITMKSSRLDRDCKGLFLRGER